MQILTQDRSINRLFFFSLCILALIAGTWIIASQHRAAPAMSKEIDFSLENPSRLGASTDEQIQTLQTQLRNHPNDWQSYSQLGLVYLQKVRETGDPSYYPKVEEALNKSLEHQSDDYVTLSAMGALELARHQFSSALDWGERARQINPDRPYAYGVIADAQIELGQYTEAVQTLQTMVDLRPDMSSYSRISYLRELHGDTNGALDVMQQAVDGGTPNLESTAWTRTQLGNLYFNSGNLMQAEAEYQQTLHDRPNYVYALAGLGRVRAAQGNTKEAIKFLNQAIAIIPMPDFVITLGDLYQTTGQQALATQQYELVGTIEKLYQANGVDLDMEIALFNADHNRNMNETVVLARKAYSNRPSIQGADALAWVLYQTGQYQEAQKYSKEALQLGTKDALKLFHAGMIAHALHNDGQAGPYLQQALAINPHFSILYAELAKTTLQLIEQSTK